MVYVSLLAVFGLILVLIRRRLGIPVLIALATYLCLRLWSSQLASLLLGFGLDYSARSLAGLIEIVGVGLITGLAIYRSAMASKSSLQLLTDVLVFCFGLLFMLHESIESVVVMDQLSISISVFLAPYTAVIATIVVVFAVHEVLAKSD